MKKINGESFTLAIGQSNSGKFSQTHFKYKVEPLIFFFFFGENLASNVFGCISFNQLETVE